jgi:hypothetical protein
MDKEEIERLTKFGITLIPGKKGPNDKIVLYKEQPITMRELGELYAIICNNEEELYPKPRFKGSDMISEYLEEVRMTGKVTDEIRKKYKVN